MTNDLKILDIPELYYAYYDTYNLQNGSNHANTVYESVETAGGIIQTNFYVNKEFPEGYGLAIIPLTIKINYLIKKIGVCIAAIPEYKTLQATETGDILAQELIQKALTDKILKTAILKVEYPETKLPMTVKDYSVVALDI